MRTFSDAQNRTWTIDINFTSLKRVKSLTGIDLTKLVDPKSDIVSRLTGDLFVFFECLVALLQPQLDANGITPEAFGEALDEEAGDNAVIALLEGVIDFFPEKKRMLLRRALAKVTRAAERKHTGMLDRALKSVESPQFDRAIETALANLNPLTSGNSPTNSPASSASTRAP